MRRGIVADGQAEAIKRICSWLDAWRQDHETGPWWPEMITLEETRLGRLKQTRPLRPSWCYGTPGLARSQQLAAQATADTDRQRLAEQALISCLNDPEQLEWITDHSLCHGSAGLFQTAWHIAADAHTPDLTAPLHNLAERLLTPNPPARPSGFSTARRASRSRCPRPPPTNRPPLAGMPASCSPDRPDKVDHVPRRPPQRQPATVASASTSSSTITRPPSVQSSPTLAPC